MRVRILARSLGLTVLLAGSLLGLAPGSAAAASTDFTIGIPGKTGCLVCHGDPKLTEVKDKKALYISESESLASVHKDVPCVKCHTDFDASMASQSHQNKITDSKKVAGLSCKNCHEHSKQLKIYNKSTHGRMALGGDSKAPTCADCHGSHDIKSLKKNKAYKAEFQMSAREVCGKCHKKSYDSYSDYYHGRAYKTGATDAPACWDCHGSHDILPAENVESKVSSRNLAKTCGDCHTDSRTGFTDFGRLIHGRQTILNKNIVFKYADIVYSWASDKVTGIASAASKGKKTSEGK
jgi:hypothetical protein